VAPAGNELARLDHREGGLVDSLFTVRPLRFSPSDNPVATSLPLLAPRASRSIAGLAGYQEEEEGATKLGAVQGPDAYMIAFTASAAPGFAPGSSLLGKLLLVPGPGERPRRGVTIEVLQTTDDRRVLRAARRYPASFFANWPINFWLDTAVAVTVPDRLEQPLKSFRFD
jgi:hypothetical protein